MSDHLTTNPFPDTISARVFDLVPSYCRSVRLFESPDGGTTYRGEAHRSEIGALRKAIRIARDEAAFRRVG